jgi:dihydrofolate reductase
MFNMVSVDGYFEGPNADLNWHHVDEEFNDFAIQQLNSADGLMFGRKTYQMMASYWPTPFAIENDPTVAEKMNSIPKYVFSHTLDVVKWNNATLLKADAATELTQLKQKPGKDLLLFGSAMLASTFIKRGLIDEYRLMVNPILLGCGELLFRNMDEKVDLHLLNTTAFRNGNVLLDYALA